MNVASKELSEELYELSGWGWYIAPDATREHYYRSRYKDDDEAWVDGELVVMTPRERINIQMSMLSQPEFPAYDLGYLLRKLPDYVKLFRNDKHKWYCATVTGGFKHPGNQLGQPDTAHSWYIADTPEDAAVELCIELFKQEILHKEPNTHE